MQNHFIEKITVELQQAGYLTEPDPRIPEVQALLYAHSPKPFRLGFATVQDYFLFVDWENSLFGRLDSLVEAYRRFSRFVNKGYSVPHALRSKIPNVALVAVSRAEFPADVIQKASTTNQTPWYGGETGQIILVELDTQKIGFQIPSGLRRFPRPGDLPLTHAVEVVNSCYQRALVNTG